MNDVLAAIDAEVAKCICGTVVPADGASLDYCSPECQYGYAGPRGSHRLGRGLPDGRTLNEQVARSLTNTIPIGEHYQDAMHSDSSTRHWTNPDEQAYQVAYYPPGSFANPNAPTAAELARQGVDLTSSMHTSRDWVEALEALNSSVSMSAIEFVEQVSAAAGMSALEAARAFNELTTALGNESLTGEDFRRRALEHQQQRGTGPAEHRQRLPRDHGPRRPR
jgi:hypothetical protein